MGRKRKNPEKYVTKKKNKEIRIGLINKYVSVVKDKIDYIFEDVIDSMCNYNEDFKQMTHVYRDSFNLLCTNRYNLDIDGIINIIENSLDMNGEEALDDMNNVDGHDLGISCVNSIMVPLNGINSQTETGFNSLRTYLNEVESEIDKEHLDFVFPSIVIKTEDIFHEYRVSLISSYMMENVYFKEFLEAKYMFLDYAVEIIEDIKETENQDEIKRLEESLRKQMDPTENEEVLKINNRVRCTYKDMHEFLLDSGFEQERQNSTTHLIFKNRDGISLPIPNKSKANMCPPGTMHSILKQSNLTKNDLIKYLQK